MQLLVFIAAAAGASRINFSGVAGEINELPGAPSALDFKMFGGYVPNANGKTFFWFVESTSGNSATDPTLLWTNGGPGCSGLVGFMTEQGPFRPTESGSLELNPTAWNNLANMVFIEQPVGVGFSVAKGVMKYGDAQAAADNLAFVKGFFQKFGMLRENDFFITSESYGGHYMPTLAKAILDDGSVPNFKGFMVGNPLTYMPYRNFGEFGTAYGHQLLPKPLWDEYASNGCRSALADQQRKKMTRCDEIEAHMENITKGFDPYALDFPKCGSPLAVGRHERFVMAGAIRAANAVRRNGTAVPSSYFPASYTPCDSDWATAYLSRKDVQTAIHAAPGGPTWGGKWSSCSDAVGNAFSTADVNAPMMPIYSELIKTGKLRILVYSGDDDSVCATLGTQQWIWDVCAINPF